MSASTKGLQNFFVFQEANMQRDKLKTFNLFNSSIIEHWTPLHQTPHNFHIPSLNWAIFALLESKWKATNVEMRPSSSSELFAHQPIYPNTPKNIAMHHMSIFNKLAYKGKHEFPSGAVLMFSISWWSPKQISTSVTTLFQ
jgi:hypothetical protein